MLNNSHTSSKKFLKPFNYLNKKLPSFGFTQDATTSYPEEEEEKQRLIERVLELQRTLDDLSRKVTDVKEENYKLKSENQILNSYIDKLINTSNVFQSALQQKHHNK